MERKKHGSIISIISNNQITIPEAEKLKTISQLLIDDQKQKEAYKEDLKKQINLLKSLMKKPQSEILNKKNEIIKLLISENQKQREKLNANRKILYENKASLKKVEDKLEEILLPMQNQYDKISSDIFILENSIKTRENMKKKLKTDLSQNKKDYFFMEKTKEIYVRDADGILDYLEKLSLKQQQNILNISRNYNKIRNKFESKTKKKNLLLSCLAKGKNYEALNTEDNNKKEAEVNKTRMVQTEIKVKPKRNSFTSIAILPKEELFHISEDEYEGDEIIQEELVNDEGINFEDKIIPKITIQKIDKLKGRLVAPLNLKQIEYNKKKAQNESPGRNSRLEQYSIPRRIQIKKKMIKALQKQMIKSKEKIQRFVSLIKSIKEKLNEVKFQLNSSCIFDSATAYGDYFSKIDTELIIKDAEPIVEEEPEEKGQKEIIKTEIKLSLENNLQTESKKRRKNYKKDPNKSF